MPSEFAWNINPNTLDRTVIIGNTASGKTHLSKRLGATLSLMIVELDQIRWIDGDFSKKELAETALAKTIEKSAHEQWVIEGVYGWLVAPILKRATCLIWTDISWQESRKNLFSRELSRGDRGNFEELEVWGADYWKRGSHSSYAAHLWIFEKFSRAKFRLKSKQEVDAFSAQFEKGT